MYARTTSPRRRSEPMFTADPAMIESLEARTLLAVDLVGAFINSSPHSLAPGEDFSAAMVVNNDGSDAAPGFGLQMRLSTDSVWGNSDDVVLGDVDRPAGLAAFSSTSIVRMFTIPDGTAPGTYFLAFSVDPTGAISESNESNNIYFTSSQLVTVTEGGGGDVDLDVFGNGQEILDGAISPSADNHTSFGDVDIGQTLDRTFTLFNDGAGTLQILSVSISGFNDLDFVIVGTSTFSLGAGQQASITIRFSPLAEGIRVASIQIETNDTNDGTGDPSEFSFAISGLGHEDDGTPVQPEIEIRGNGQVINNGDMTPRLADFTGFGRLRLENAAQTRTFTVFNTGDGVLLISGIEVRGRNADQFELLDQIDSIAPGESATFRIRFNPDSRGMKVANIFLFSNDADESEYNFRLKGTGAVNGGVGDGVAEIGVLGNGLSITNGDTSPSAFDHTGFGRVRQDDQTRTRTYTIINSGQGTLDIDSISVLGRDASNFVVLDTLTSVTAGQSATFRVRFDPDGLGNRRANIHINSNDANASNYTFRVRGNGISNPGGEGMITVAGLTLIEDGDTTPTIREGSNFGRVNVGQAMTRTFTITNTGSGVLNLVGPFVQITGNNAPRFTILEMPDTSIAAGESTTFVVQFNPNAGGLRRAVVEIHSSDSEAGIFDFRIMGRGRLV